MRSGLEADVFCRRAPHVRGPSCPAPFPETSLSTAPTQLPETPYYGKPWLPLALALSLLPVSTVFFYTMGALLAGYGPPQFVERMTAVYIIPLALAPFAALNILFLHRAVWLIRLHRWGRPGAAAIESLEAESRADGSPTGRTLIVATVSVAGAPPYTLKSRLRAPREMVEAALPPEGLPIRTDPRNPRKVLIEASVPGARF